MNAGPAPMGGTVLIARLDNAGDVLLAGPAVRAVAAEAPPTFCRANQRSGVLLEGPDRVWRQLGVLPERGTHRIALRSG